MEISTSKHLAYPPMRMISRRMSSRRERVRKKNYWVQEYSLSVYRDWYKATWDVQEQELTAWWAARRLVTFQLPRPLGCWDGAELFSAIQSSLKRTVTSLDEDNWIFEPNSWSWETSTLAPCWYKQHQWYWKSLGSSLRCNINSCSLRGVISQDPQLLVA